MNDVRTTDVLIAGQGASAYAAALYSARYQQDTLMVAEQFGGETATGGQIENYPGVPDIDGYDLMLKFKEADGRIGRSTGDVQSPARQARGWPLRVRDG